MIPIEAYPVLHWYNMKQAWKPVRIGGYFMCNPYAHLMNHYLQTNIIYKN